MEEEIEEEVEAVEEKEDEEEEDEETGNLNIGKHLLLARIEERLIRTFFGLTQSDLVFCYLRIWRTR